MSIWKISALLAALCVSTSTLPAAEPIKLQDGKDIVFWGDSITDFGWYTPYVQLALDLKMPEKNIAVINSGVGGDTVGRAMVRLDYDALNFKPSLVFMAIGANDVTTDNYSSEAFAKRMGRTADELGKAVAEIKNAGAEPVVIGVFAYDEYSSDLKAKNAPGRNSIGNAKINEEFKKLAERENLKFIDILTPMTKTVEANPAAHLCGPDRLHPSRTGHLLIALELFKALDLDKRNASVVIENGKALAKNATVGNLATTKNSMKFTYKPDTLPLPVDGAYRELARISPLPSELNKETIAAKGLEAGKYVLKFNGVEVGKFTEGQLAEGVDVATLETPNQSKAKLLIPILEKYHAAMAPIRKIAASIMVAKMEKADLNDTKDIDRKIDAWLEKCKSSPVYEGRRQSIEMYRKCRDHKQELEKNLADLREQLRAGAKPVECNVEITKVDK